MPALENIDRSSLLALVEISREINSIQDTDELLSKILQIAMQTLAAERGFILLQAPETETGFVAWLNARPIAKQFLKFCVAGGTSTVIDVGLHYTLMFMNFGGQSLSVAVGEWWSQLVGTGAIDPDKAQKLAVPILKIPTASLAIVNSFVLNRYWTFKIRDKEERGVQFARFVVV
ncbi:hypothetical protein DWB58_21180, partial [candidate division KSB1 bacterium]|nr:hypothetical protein [candidate division KSB1 bacterium]